MYAYFLFLILVEFSTLMNNTRDEIRLKEFGEHFRRIRKSKKLSQKALAFEADIEVSQISRIENGNINTTVTTILLLAQAMDVPASKLFDFKPTKGKK
jgi:transcriptional regulator with XRE-family HTH domain